MKSLTRFLLGCLLFLMAARPAAALDFSIDVSSYTFSNSIINYGVSVHLNADINDFDELIDGFQVTSPDGTFSLFVDTETLSASQGFLYPIFPDATDVIYGEWTLESLVLGLSFESYTFQVSDAGLSVLDYRPAQINFPSFGATGISPRPGISFAGPPDATQIGVGLTPATGEYPNGGFALLPASATQYLPPYQLTAGSNDLYVIYYLPNGNPDKVLIETPSEVAWNAVFTRSCIAFSEFTVSATDLRILGVERVGDAFRWRFPTEVGRTYDVEFTEDLNATSWQILQTIAGDGTVKSFQVAANPGTKFFRVVKR